MPQIRDREPPGQERGGGGGGKSGLRSVLVNKALLQQPHPSGPFSVALTSRVKESLLGLENLPSKYKSADPAVGGDRAVDGGMWVSPVVQALPAHRTEAAAGLARSGCGGPSPPATSRGPGQGPALAAQNPLTQLQAAEPRAPAERAPLPCPLPHAPLPPAPRLPEE